MIVKNTDRRFKLYSYGFTKYIEFTKYEHNLYRMYKQVCRKTIGEEFWMFDRYYNDRGKNWRSEYDKRKPERPYRIYIRGDKYYTLLAIAAAGMNSENTFYL